MRNFYKSGSWMSMIESDRPNVGAYRHFESMIAKTKDYALKLLFYASTGTCSFSNKNVGNTTPTGIVCPQSTIEILESRVASTT
jgi:hypothetical protein